MFRAMNHSWIEDYALFAAIKEEHNGRSWTDWEPTIAHHDLEAVKRWREELCDQVQFHVYIQYLFYCQWQRLKRYANERGVSIIGDLPFYVAHDSADLWSNRDLFWLDADGALTDVAGAPPDAYSAVGQLWGNPLYRWDVLAQQDYEWWVRRLQAVLSTFDMVRLDHFRGFAAVWAVPSTEETALNGRWEPGPGAALFEVVQERLGRPSIIAEDLGVITPDVEALRDQFGFPGMRVLHYAFGSGPGSPSLPHNHPRNCVVYTGTHDNDTTAGWWASASPLVRQHVLEYLGYDIGEEVNWALIRMALASVANMAIVPLQDVLSLGSEARMNTPGRSGGNWSWRVIPDMLTSQLADRLRALTVLYQRAES
jgi:4-alpha-glucanotransferase